VVWRTGSHVAGFLKNDPLHADLATWIWGRVVQQRLDRHVYETNAHKIRKQKNTHLPSGGSRNDFCDFPEEYGMKNLLIPVDEADIDQLLDEHRPRALFQFSSDHGEVVAQELYVRLGSPHLDVSSAWDVFRGMLVEIVRLNP